MKAARYLLLTIPALGWVFVTLAQNQDPNPTATYQKLVNKDSTLNVALDSLQIRLKTNRQLFEDNPEKSDSLGGEIIKLETAIYDIRSQLSRIGTQMATLEIDMAQRRGKQLNNAGQFRNFLAAPFFQNNLSASDRKLLSTTSTVLSKVSGMKKDLNNLYLELVDLKTAFDAATTQNQIDQTITQSANLKAKITALDNHAADAWITLYNRKLDNYLVMVDKLGGADRTQLEATDVLNRDVFHMQSIEGDLSPTMAAMISQVKLLLSYEVMLSEKLQLTSAVDSLKAVQKQVETLIPAVYPDIQFPYRSLVVYSSITFDNEYPYQEVEQVPALKLPESSVYYAVQVALINKPASALSIFKGALPLQVEKTANGYYRYVIGGFKNYSDASAALKQASAEGYKSPSIAAWVKGGFTTALKAKAYQEANPHMGNSSDYKIEITTSDASIAALLKSTLDMNAPGKTIARTEQNGVYTYTITQFVTEEEAKVIAQIIQTKQPALSEIKVVPVSE